MFAALENGWRYRLGCNGAPIGNGTCGIKSSNREVVAQIYMDTNRGLPRKSLETDTRLQKTTDRKYYIHVGYGKSNGLVFLEFPSFRPCHPAAFGPVPSVDPRASNDAAFSIRIISLWLYG